MTRDLETVLADYGTGLDAELSLLGEFEELAARQRALPNPAPPETLTHLARERERLLGALTALERDAYQVLVSDIMMPGTDGYDGCRQVKSLRRNGRQLPVVMLTSR